MRLLSLALVLSVSGLCAAAFAEECGLLRAEDSLIDRYGHRYALGRQFDDIGAVAAVLDAAAKGGTLPQDVARGHATSLGVEFDRLISQYRYDDRRDIIEVGTIEFDCWEARDLKRAHVFRPFIGLRRRELHANEPVPAAGARLNNGWEKVKVTGRLVLQSTYDSRFLSQDRQVHAEHAQGPGEIWTIEALPDGTYAIKNEAKKAYLSEQITKLCDSCGPGEKWEFWRRKTDPDRGVVVWNTHRLAALSQDKQLLSQYIGSREYWHLGAPQP